MIHPKHVLQTLQIRARKKWGQNFLVHENNVKSIFEFAHPSPKTNILEIGPGLGAMTQVLCAHAKKYIGVEYDPILFGYLQETYKNSNTLFIHQDILETKLEDIFPGEKFEVVANLPYHITTPILDHLLTQRSRIQNMTLLLQKEVVDRIIAKAGSKTYGRMSVWIQSLCNVEKGPVLKPGCFYPQPDIDSQVIRLTPLDVQIDEKFLAFIRILFQKRRKTLGRILKDQDLSTTNVQADYLQLRPEDLSIDQLKEIFKKTL
ncbi:MAG: ribosomal RNA small subunit methyltransferase A [Bdellovibrionales bacterium]|nr:ribosomal RNA small subunit methyltransferase A [Bdellovibrionales bacterium]